MMRMFSAILLISSALPCWAEQKIQSIQDIPKEIREGAPKELAKFIFSNSKIENQVLENIKKGKKDWVKLFPRILSGTDAGWTEELLAAIPYALKKSPQETLASIKEAQVVVPHLKDVLKNNCGNTIEGFDDVSPQKFLAKKALKELESRKKSLTSLSDPVFTQIKSECLNSIDASVSRWKKSEK